MKRILLFILPDSQIISKLVSSTKYDWTFLCPELSLASICMSTLPFVNQTFFASVSEVLKVCVSIRWECFMKNPFGHTLTVKGKGIFHVFFLKPSTQQRHFFVWLGDNDMSSHNKSASISTYSYPSLKRSSWRRGTHDYVRSNGWGL